MDKFSDRFKIVYEKFVSTRAGGEPASKLAFSRFMGVAQAVMQNWEKGSIPLPKYLKIIHDRLGFDYGWLITGEGDPFGAAQAENTREIELEAEIAELKSKLQQADDINRKLTARLLVEGTSELDAENSQKAIGQK